MAAGAVPLAYNLPEIKGQELRLSRAAYCGIVTGKVTRWNDQLIQKDNPGVNLPDRPLTFAHRSDGSGTTFIFVNHIDAACPDWQAGVGTSVNWPTGVGAQGNEGFLPKFSRMKVQLATLSMPMPNSIRFQLLYWKMRQVNSLHPAPSLPQPCLRT